MLLNDQKIKLNKILSKAGDLSFKRRVVEIMNNLDILPGEKVLDIGCGEGFYSMVLSELFDCKIYAVDADPKILSLAKKRLKHKKNVYVAKGDLKDLGFNKNFFDKIICSEVIEHISEEESALKEVYRVLKPGGTAIFTVPNSNYPFFWDPINKIREGLGLGHFNPYNRYLGGVWSLGHKRLYTPTDLKKVLEKAGFQIINLKVLTRYCVPFNLLLLNLGKVFYTNMPVSDNTKTSMEKFDWDSEFKNPIIKLIYNVFLWIDSFNETRLSLNNPSTHVFAKVTKK